MHLLQFGKQKKYFTKVKVLEVWLNFYIVHFMKLGLTLFSFPNCVLILIISLPVYKICTTGYFVLYITSNCNSKIVQCINLLFILEHLKSVYIILSLI